MRTINVKNNLLNTKSVAKVLYSMSDRQPCWYADLEVADDRQDYKWKVGCKSYDKTDEYLFKISSGGDVNDEEFWNLAVGKDFAVKLLLLFKSGGGQAISRWVKQGCVL